MGVLPDSLVTLDARGHAVPGAQFRRVDPHSPEGRKLTEADWDGIICANVAPLASAFRAAGVIAPDSTLRVVGQQVEAIDVLLAEVRADEEGSDEHGHSLDAGPKRLLLLEDKLVRNPEAKRQVLAQILDYAHRAQTTWTTDTLCRSLDPVTAAWLRPHAAHVDAMLAQGEVVLVIAGDAIDENLLRLAERFATSANPLSLTELCLVSMAVYQRGEERLFIPHVVSAVERHQRQLSIRVTVKGADGAILPATVERDEETEVGDARRGAMPRDEDVARFLRKAKEVITLRLGGDACPYEVTGKGRKVVAFWLDGEARLKIHFGGFAGNTWSPILVGLFVNSRGKRDEWVRRVEAARAAGKLPVGTVVKVSGETTVEALKPFEWSTPSELTEELLHEVTETLMRFEEAFGNARES